MEFSFVHAADLHIDSPFAGLGLKDAAVAERFMKASRAAVEALIDETIRSKAAFLVVAGDVFDGDWKDVGAGLFFVKELGRLARAGVATVIARGNHDADSVMSKRLPYPQAVHVFPSERATTTTFEALRVALHGRSFSSRRTDGDFVLNYPARREGWFNIGVLHTGLDGSRGHETYAPCTVDDLKRFGYDYWALGHVHAAEIVARDPWIVYPGNIQGRSVRETGAKGAVRVVVADGRVQGVESIVLDAARWADAAVDASLCQDVAEVADAVRATLERLHNEAEGRPLAARLTLTGVSPAHTRFVAARETIEEEARAIGLAIAEDCWVEKVAVATSPPSAIVSSSGEPDAVDVEGLIAAAALDPEFGDALSQIVAAVADKLPRALRGETRPDDAVALAAFAAAARDRLIGELAS